MPALRPVSHEDRLSLVEHLDELRTRLIVCLAAVFVCFAFTYWQNDAIFDFVNRPLDKATQVKGDEGSKDPFEQSARFDKALGTALGSLAPAVSSLQETQEKIARDADVSPDVRAALAAQQRQVDQAVRQLQAAARAAPQSVSRQPITLGVTEPFLTTFTVAGYAALLLALPLILYQAYAFLLPAFSPQEKKVAIPLMLMVPVLFILGVVFAYYVALPRAVDFLLNFNDDAFDILVQARDYYKFSVLLMGAIGLMFQVPVGVLAVTRLGVVSTKQLRAWRGYALLVIAVLAAVATPTPDPVTMVISMAPLVVLYELSVQLARIFEPKGPSRWSWDDDDEDEDDDDWESGWADYDEDELEVHADDHPPR